MKKFLASFVSIICAISAMTSCSANVNQTATAVTTKPATVEAAESTTTAATETTAITEAKLLENENAIFSEWYAVQKEEWNALDEFERDAKNSRASKIWRNSLTATSPIDGGPEYIDIGYGTEDAASYVCIASLAIPTKDYPCTGKFEEDIVVLDIYAGVFDGVVEMVLIRDSRGNQVELYGLYNGADDYAVYVEKHGITQRVTLTSEGALSVQVYDS